jgi:hypothetical protein
VDDEMVFLPWNDDLAFGLARPSWGPFAGALSLGNLPEAAPPL